jgi:hypothetical protein
MNVRSRTEGKLVAVDNAATMILCWTKLFLEAQGYDKDKNIVYQDNKSAILLETNDKKSLGKQTRTLNIRYFFITNQVEKANAQIEHCGTNNMAGDFFQSLCKARSSNDFGTISPDAYATYQDTWETRHDVTQDKEQFEEQKISSSGKRRKRTLVHTVDHKEMRRQPKRLKTDNKPKRGVNEDDETEEDSLDNDNCKEQVTEPVAGIVRAEEVRLRPKYIMMDYDKSMGDGVIPTTKSLD